MDPDFALRIGREALLLVIILSAPVVCTALIVGILVSVLQAATQLQDQTLSFVPKLAAMIVVLGLSGLWMIGELTQFTTSLFELLPRIAITAT